MSSVIPVEVFAENYTPRSDLLNKLLPDTDLTIFTDGSSSVNKG
jgi:hypothetical protein